MSDKKITVPNNFGPNCIGNVIRILDNRTLIVNAGNDYLSEGNKIAVYVPVETIYDLDGTPLEVYEYTKDTLEVISVSKSYSICRKMKEKVIESSTLSGLVLSPLFEGKKEFVPMNVNEEEISPLPDIDSEIHLGDPIKIV